MKLDILKKLDILINRQELTVPKDTTLQEELPRFDKVQIDKPAKSEKVKSIMPKTEREYEGVLNTAVKLLQQQPKLLTLSGRNLEVLSREQGRTISYRTWNKAKKIVGEGG